MTAKRVFYGFIVIIILAVGIILTIAAGWSQALKDEKVAWAAIGGVTTSEELFAANPDLPAQENAATHYEAAIRLLPEELPESIIDPSNASADTLIADLDAFSRVLELIRRGAQHECQWVATDVDVSGFERTGQMRKLIRICIAQSYALASRDDEADDEEAVRYLQLATIMSRHIAAHPSVLSPMVGIVCENAIQAAIHDLYENTLETPIRTMQLVRALEDVDYQQMMEQALLGEGAYGCEMLEWSQPRFQFRRIPVIASWHDKGQAAYLKYVREMVEFVSTRDMPEMVAADAPVPDRDWTARQVASALDLFVRQVVDAAARNTVCAAGLRARIHQGIHGAYPATDEFTDLPIDPYTGEPIIYERLEEGAVLRCDGTDREGKPVEWTWTR